MFSHPFLPAAKGRRTNSTESFELEDDVRQPNLCSIFLASAFGVFRTRRTMSTETLELEDDPRQAGARTGPEGMRVGPTSIRSLFRWPQPMLDDMQRQEGGALMYRTLINNFQVGLGFSTHYTGADAPCHALTALQNRLMATHTLPQL